VGSSGLVTGVADGSATISVKSVDGAIVKNCRVTVISDETYTITYDTNGGTGTVPLDDKSYLQEVAHAFDLHQ